MRKGDGADGQRAKIVGNFTTDEGEERMLRPLMELVAASVTIRACGCSKYKLPEYEYEQIMQFFTEHTCINQ